MLKKLKKKICFSNGYIGDEGTFVLQGDHIDAVYEYLVNLGISKSQIIRSGIL